MTIKIGIIPMSGMEKSPKPLQIIKTVGVINTREKGARMNIY